MDMNDEAQAVELEMCLRDLQHCIRSYQIVRPRQERADHRRPSLVGTSAQVDLLEKVRAVIVVNERGFMIESALRLDPPVDGDTAAEVRRAGSEMQSHSRRMDSSRPSKAFDEASKHIGERFETLNALLFKISPLAQQKFAGDLADALTARLGAAFSDTSSFQFDAPEDSPASPIREPRSPIATSTVKQSESVHVDGREDPASLLAPGLSPGYIV
ncbi:hypothetical protein GQ42DRAFT_50592 [Ramicandelaber brevisporus]|nr:hypothetical protein GQ42DRAFT_50592 [Ramicandelaber brevisporus]